MDAMADVKITVRNHGPLRVEGPFTLVDADGKEYGIAQRQWVSLCRCGLSETKPICDGAHKRNGWQSECHAFDLGLPPPPKPKPAP
jgi:CDGSH-type Zn-finger protein